MYKIWRQKEKFSGPAYDGVQESLSQCFHGFFRLVYTLSKSIRHLTRLIMFTPCFP